MTDASGKTSWVWWSDGRALSDGPADKRPLSVLAIVETALASAAGLWLWTAGGLYPLMLSSLVMAFLTMLRSPASVALGARWFETYRTDTTESSLGSLRGLAIWFLPVLISGLVSYWLASEWIAPNSGWSAFWRGIVVGLLALNLGYAGAIAVEFGIAIWVMGLATVGAVVGAFLASGLFAIMATVIGIGAVFGLEAVTIISFGLFLGILVRAMVTRALATLRYLQDGLALFPQNWTALVTSVDARTEPELVPALPKSSLRLQRARSNLKKDDLSSWGVAALFALLLFLPPILFRFTLKTTFVFYWPLLFVTSAPKALKTKDGLIWDAAQGRGAHSWIYFALALGTCALIGLSIYDDAFYAGFAPWAEAHGLHAYQWTRLFGLNLGLLDIWGVCALLSSGLTVVLVLWANSINTRLKHMGTQPGWIGLKLYFVLSRLRLLLVLATVAVTAVGVLWFVHDSCTLWDWATQVFEMIFGAPQACGAA